MLFFIVQLMLDGVTREQFRGAYRVALEEAYSTDGISNNTRCYLIKDIKNLLYLVMRSRRTTKLGRLRKILELRSTVRAARLLQKDSGVKGVGWNTEISQLATIPVRPGGGSGAGLGEPNLVNLDTFINMSDANMAAICADVSSRRRQAANTRRGLIPAI